MRVKFDFNVSAWLNEVEIDANSIDEAKEELRKMSLLDLVRDAQVKQLDITDLDVEVVDSDYEVEVTKLTFEPSFFEYDTEDEKKALIDKVGKEKLPIKFYLRGVTEQNLEDEIESRLEEMFDVSGTWKFDYKILKQS